MGSRKKKGRDISGILILDKPAGISSNQALQRVKRLYQANKAGHTGSLDVPASGLLPICLGEATKVSGYLLDADKTYIARGQLGIATDTGDAQGKILKQQAVTGIDEGLLNQTLAQFLGKQEQIPPMFSALKHNGKRLYELAYQGIEVKREPRTISIHEIELLDFNGEQFEISVSCSKGTYIRTLIQDIAAALDNCAHVTMLRRISSGPFSESQMLGLPELERLVEQESNSLDELLLPVDAALRHFPDISLSEDNALSICQGRTLDMSGLPAAGCMRIYDQSDKFIGIGEIKNAGQLSPKRLINME